MDSLIFIGMIACLGLVAIWYAANEASGADGRSGVLAIAPDADGEAPAARRYRVKTRGRPAQSGDRLERRADGVASGRAYREKKAPPRLPPAPQR